MPVFEDIRKLNKEALENVGIKSVDVICGGFPCQPFSVAGKQAGKEDDRHLWPEMFRLIKETRPRWVIGENVAGFINMALDDVLSDLESEGYETQSFVIPACAVGGIHRRDRVWIVANSNDCGRCARSDNFGEGQVSPKQKRELEKSKQKGNRRKCGIGEGGNFTNVADSNDCEGARQQRDSGKVLQKQKTNGCGETLFRKDDTDTKMRQWDGLTTSEEYGESAGKIGGQHRQKHYRPIEPPTEPPVRHRDDGLPDNVARLKALGNAVVPQIPEIIGRAIMEIENGN